MTMDVLEDVYGAFSDANLIEGPLKDRLAGFQRKLVEIVPPIGPAYESLVTRFRDTIDGNVIPNVGDPMPDFVLPNSSDGLTGLSELTEQGLSIISFNRGNWCFHCMLELSALAAINDSVNSMGAQIISVVPERIPHLKAMSGLVQLPFPVLSDLDHGLGTALGLVVSARNELRELFLAAGLDLSVFQGNESWMLPIPAIFIVDGDGIIQARFLDPDFRTRTEPDDVMKTLKEIADRH